MEEREETLTIRVKKSKVKAFRDMLKLFDFVKIESPVEKVDRYIRNAPNDIPLTDDDIMRQAMELSESKTKKAIVEEALSLFIHFRRQEKISALRGQLNWESDLNLK